MYFSESYIDLLDQIKAKESIGIDYRQDEKAKQLYREAKDARSDARLIEREVLKQQADDTSGNYWKIVANHTLKLLLEYTFNIEIAAWLLESLCRLDGYEGCTFGFEVIAYMCETFGAQLYPQLEEDDEPEWQWLALTGLNGEDTPGSLITPLHNIAITESPVIYLWQYERALKESSDNDDTHYISLDECYEAVREAGVDHFSQQLQSLECCMTVFENLGQVFWQKLSDLAPPTTRIKNTLEKNHQLLKQLMIDIFGAQCLETSVDTAANETEQVSATHAHSASGGLNNRSDAIQGIIKIADYFRAHEPHSPIPYMLLRTVEWANLSWPELMQAMIKSGDEINHIVEQTGMPVHQEGSDY